MIAQFYNVCKSYQTPDGEKIILDKFNLRIQRGDRIGIVGRNGSGKTSFLKMLVGELVPDAGTVKKAHDLALSYFDQKRKDLQGDDSLHRVLCPNGSDYIEVQGKPRHVYGYLKSFLFDPKMASHSVNTLSGGQKNRLLLAKILANPGNFLILDEPTNDLDMDTLDMLEDMLANYTGTLIVVSHDRDFLDQTVSKILAFEGNGQVDGYIGGYKDYLEGRKKNAESGRDLNRDEDGVVKPIVRKSDTSATPIKSDARLSYKQQYELDNLPATIAKLEEQIASMETEMADPDLYAKNADRFNNLSINIGANRQKLEDAEQRWLELEELRQSMVNANSGMSSDA